MEYKRLRILIKRGSRVSARFINRNLVATVEIWWANVSEPRSMAKTSKVVMRSKMQGAFRCLDAWMLLTVKEARKLALMGRIMARMMSKCLVFSTDIWHANVLLARKEYEEKH